MTSLTDTLTRLTTLARDHGASITHTIQLEFGGAGLLLFWDSTDSPTSSPHDLPRQALLRFVIEDDGGDSFTSAFVYSGRSYIWALDQGLTDQQARQESKRLVGSLREVEAYLLGQPYKVIPRDWWQAPYSALDSDTVVD